MYYTMLMNQPLYITALLAGGVDVNRREPVEGLRPLALYVTDREILVGEYKNTIPEYPVDAPDKLQSCILRLLLHHPNLSIDQRALSSGHTAFHLALINGRARFAEMLLEHGADINSRTFAGETSLFCALHGGDSSCVLLVLSRSKRRYKPMVFVLKLRSYIMGLFGLREPRAR
jgi:hypothetical protein